MRAPRVGPCYNSPVNKLRVLLVLATAVLAVVALPRIRAATPAASAASSASTSIPAKEIIPVGSKLDLTEDEWKAKLSPEQFKVLRKEGTERAFTGHCWDEHRPGVYSCAGCGAPLFAAETKFDSGTGWPSYWQPIEPGRVAERIDGAWFMKRTEVHCDRCGGHLGHVFPDGPAPTGLRYCINGVSLTFEAKK